MTDVASSTISRPGGLDPQQLGRLVDQLPVLVWSTDEKLRLTSRYGGGLALVGPVPGPGEGLRVGEVESPSEAVRAVNAHQAALRGEATTYEVSFRGRTFTCRVEPLYKPEGRICGVAGICFDITERRRAEVALQESETRLRTIIESEPECVKLLDEQGRLLDMNPAGLAMVEADSLDVVRGRQIVEVVVPEHRAAFTELHRRVFAGESGTLEFEIIGLKGKRSWMETHAVPLRDASGAIRAALGISRDVSRRKIAELALVESEERFCKAFYANALPLLITRLDDGMVLDANQAFTALVNRPRDEIIGQTTVALGVIDAGRRADHRDARQDRRRHRYRDRAPAPRQSAAYGRALAGPHGAGRPAVYARHVSRCHRSEARGGTDARLTRGAAQPRNPGTGHSRKRTHADRTRDSRQPGAGPDRVQAPARRGTGCGTQGSPGVGGTSA